MNRNTRFLLLPELQAMIQSRFTKGMIVLVVLLIIAAIVAYYLDKPNILGISIIAWMGGMVVWMISCQVKDSNERDVIYSKQWHEEARVEAIKEKARNHRPYRPGPVRKPR